MERQKNKMSDVQHIVNNRCFVNARVNYIEIASMLREILHSNNKLQHMKEHGATANDLDKVLKTMQDAQQIFEKCLSEAIGYSSNSLK